MRRQGVKDKTHKTHTRHDQFATYMRENILSEAANTHTKSNLGNYDAVRFPKSCVRAVNLRKSISERSKKYDETKQKIMDVEDRGRTMVGQKRSKPQDNPEGQTERELKRSRNNE